MYVKHARNVNDLYPELMDLISVRGNRQESRNGTVLTIPDPVATVIAKPHERVLLDPERNCNPFFHLMEGLWMLAGRRDVAFLDQFNKNMVNFSDDGLIFNGAYGWRWIHEFQIHQVEEVIRMLANNPLDRRAVITMWNPNEDLGSKSKDVPCNQQMMFRVVGSTLDMLTTNRSNDVVWGLCGANAVHLTMLQEYIALALGLSVGIWTHVSNNLHLYTGPHEHLIGKTDYFADRNREYVGNFRENLFISRQTFDYELMRFLDNGPDYGFTEPFLEYTAAPVWRAWAKYKSGDMYGALKEAAQIRSDDWAAACRSWLEIVREKRSASKATN